MQFTAFRSMWPTLALMKKWIQRTTLVAALTLALNSLPISASAAPKYLPTSSSQSSDFSVALIDTLAYTADVLSFYDDEFASEAYLGTGSGSRSPYATAYCLWGC